MSLPQSKTLLVFINSTSKHMTPVCAAAVSICSKATNLKDKRWLAARVYQQEQRSAPDSGASLEDSKNVGFVAYRHLLPSQCNANCIMHETCTAQYVTI